VSDTHRLRKLLDRKLVEYGHVKDSVRREKECLADAEERLTASVEAQRIIQRVAETVQESAHRQIASVVSRCLQTVFGEDSYEFRITFEKKRGKTEARLSFVRDGVEYDPTEATGGGVVDVAAFALRLSCLLLTRPPLRRILVMDEPFRFVSREYRPAVRSLLEVLAKEMKLQIVMVTHSPELACGKVIELGDCRD